MLLRDGDRIGLREAVRSLDYNEMRKKGIESFLALIEMAKDGVKVCGHYWKFEDET